MFQLGLSRHGNPNSQSVPCVAHNSTEALEAASRSYLIYLHISLRTGGKPRKGVESQHEPQVQSSSPGPKAPRRSAPASFFNFASEASYPLSRVVRRQVRGPGERPALREWLWSGCDMPRATSSIIEHPATGLSNFSLFVSFFSMCDVCAVLTPFEAPWGGSEAKKCPMCPS
jgi:hypothetical protein